VVTVKCPPLVAQRLRRLMSAAGRSSGGIIRDLIMATRAEELPPPPPGAVVGLREPVREEHQTPE